MHSACTQGHVQAAPEDDEQPMFNLPTLGRPGTAAAQRGEASAEPEQEGVNQVLLTLPADPWRCHACA